MASFASEILGASSYVADIFWEMGKKCFVPLCKSGYRSASSEEKVSLFRAHNDEQLELWRKSIPRADRVLSKKDSVCEKHFEAHMIIREWTAEKDGHVVMKVNLQRSRLSPEAVPTVFPGCTTFLSKTVKPSRKGCRDVAVNLDLPHKQPKFDKPSSPTTNTTEDMDVASNIGELHQPSEQLELTKLHSKSFNFLWVHADEISLPSGWGIHKVQVSVFKSLIFSEMVWNKMKTMCVLRKQVQFQNDSTIPHVIVGNKIVSVPSITNAHDEARTIVDVVQNIIRCVDQWVICRGGPGSKVFPGIQPQCASVDNLGVWRHHSCPLVIEEYCNMQCNQCAKLQNTLERHTKRKRSRCFEKKS